MKNLSVRTHSRAEMLDITAQVEDAVRESGVADGVCYVYVPHTTAAITINENADPAVPRDILAHLEQLVPWDGPYSHGEGNAAAHIKASLLGASQSVFVREGRLALGRWQAIFFCEFDGPRSRQVSVEVVREQ
ncbi:MAG: secondary thiamine-phosphate synthase enzyme YjbQ [Dehalococcoidales bacterium]|nr:secondary thiamine-phosphate synthase enzyme YjbQ [Dehalococcoidales bacterium]